MDDIFSVIAVQRKGEGSKVGRSITMAAYCPRRHKKPVACRDRVISGEVENLAPSKPALDPIMGCFDLFARGPGFGLPG